MLNTLEKIGLRAEAAAQELKGATKAAKDKALLLAASEVRSNSKAIRISDKTSLCLASSKPDSQ